MRQPPLARAAHARADARTQKTAPAAGDGFLAKINATISGCCAGRRAAAGT
jgi:hypothetical protein